MGTGEDGGRTVELISETKVRLHKVKKKWLRRVTRLVRKRKLTRDLDDVRISSPSMVKGIVSIGALLSGVAIEQAVTEDVVYASEYTEETALAMTDEVTMNTVVSENAEPTSIDGEDSTEPVIEEVVEETVEESISEEETVPLARDNSRLEAIIASMKAALTELVDPGDQADSQAYKDYLEARTRLEEKLKLAEQLLQDNSRTQEELDKAALEYGQDAINLTRLAEEFRTYSASIGSGFRRLTNQEVITSGTVSLSIPSTVEPMGLSGGQLRATIQFSVNDLAKAGDQFTVTLSQNLNLSGSGVPADVKIPNIVVDGKVIATGVWNHDARTITYTLNSNVDDLQSVTGSINLSVFVDQKVVQSEGSQQFTITLNNQHQATQSSYIRYSDPVSRSDGAYSLRAYLTNINLTNGTYDHVIVI
ncbi:Ig-like domain-containing protein [Streptococcus suis]